MIYYDKKTLTVQFFKRVISLRDNEIILIYGKNTLLIKGLNMRTIYLQKDEIQICGNISSISVSPYVK